MNFTCPTRSLSGLSIEDVEELLNPRCFDWQELAGARVLVTGATGWFGTWILEALVQASRRFDLRLAVIAVSRDPARFAARFEELSTAAEISWLQADVRVGIPQIDGPVTHVIHAATEASAALNASSPEIMFDTNVSGTRHALTAAAAKEVRGFLLLSSGAVYGAIPPGLESFEETYGGGPDPLNPANAYAEGKRAAEQLCAIWHARYGVPAKIARCFAFVGPHMPFDAHFAIGNFIRDAASGGPVTVKSDGSPKRSYLYMSDLVVALFAVLLRGRSLYSYNVGAQDAVSIKELALRVAALRPGVVATIGGQMPARRDCYVPVTTRLQRELGFEARVDLDTGLERTMSWFLAKAAV